MPHLYLSTSADLVENVDVPDILAALVEAFAAQDSVDPSTLKAYHAMHMHWAMGPGAPGGFAHLEVRLLQGRPLEVRTGLADVLVQVLKAGFAQSLESGEASVTLEIREMDAATYRR